MKSNTMNNELMNPGSVPAIKTDTNASLVEIRMNPESFPRLNSYPREEAVKEMSKIVFTAFMYRGQNADPQNINFIATNLVNELMEERSIGASYISFTEISRAVKKAVLGDTEIFGISVASLYKVILDYVKGEGMIAHKEAKEKLRKQERQILDSSPVKIMLSAYAGEMIRKNRNNK